MRFPGAASAPSGSLNACGPGVHCHSACTHCVRASHRRWPSPMTILYAHVRRECLCSDCRCMHHADTSSKLARYPSVAVPLGPVNASAFARLRCRCRCRCCCRCCCRGRCRGYGCGHGCGHGRGCCGHGRGCCGCLGCRGCRLAAHGGRYIAPLVYNSPSLRTGSRCPTPAVCPCLAGGRIDS
jgi:hypothetical protein